MTITTTVRAAGVAGAIALGIGASALAGGIAAAPAHADIYSTPSQSSCEQLRQAKINQDASRKAAERRQADALRAQGKLAPYPSANLSVSACTKASGGWQFSLNYVR
ncbi:hypothetical protein [Gordonia sp. NPDC058843]|uniref:hypothetical protein n=1 Tax=Gordonia sp. NPDC058843 TaxID=3346648 RepID=UPI00369FC39B